MDNSIQVFTNEDYGTIRAIKVDGEPWFVAKDICDALGIATNHLRETLDDDEVSNLPITEVGPEFGGRAPLIVSEAGPLRTNERGGGEMLPDRLLIDARWYVAEDTIRPSAPQRATEPYELLKRLCTEYGVNCHRAYRAVAEGRLDAPLPHGTTRGRRCRRSEFVRWMEDDLMERRA